MCAYLPLPINDHDEILHKYSIFTYNIILFDPSLREIVCKQYVCDVLCLSLPAQVFDLLMGDVGKELVDKLQSNTKLFRERMVEAGFTIKVGVQ